MCVRMRLLSVQNAGTIGANLNKFSWLTVISELKNR